ncbi:MAG: hypothetical protein HKN59_05165 [Gammaproteobacteria bacterium]|nr:hypothetical protein [Gammaproteobacteria bacterium]
MNFRRLFVTFSVVLLAVLAAVGTVDETGKHYADEAFKRALVTFAVARTLNGVISVAQGTEVAVEPAGVGVNFTVGQILDPVNDLVERFSAVMLVATTSLGMQNILLKISAWWGISLFLVLAAAFYLVTLWSQLEKLSRFSYAAVRILLVAAFMRFAVAGLIIGSNLVFNTFMAAEQTAATAALETTTTEVQAISAQAEAPPAQDQTLMERLGSMLDESLDSMNVKERLESFKDRMSNASEHIINLIVIFVLQTIVLPLFFIWLIVEVLKFIATRSIRAGS